MPPTLQLRRSRLSPASLAVILAACASSHADTPHVVGIDKFPPGVNGRTTIDYYDVQGRTIAELRTDMRRKGPKLSDSSFVGETRAPMRWTWKTQSEPGSSCSIREVTVWVNAQILLPRWTPPADTLPGLHTEWQRFMTALETHEAGHKDIAARTAREIQTKLRDVSGLCSMINTRASDLARTILDKGHEAQRQYDADTRHGLTQGTGFGRGPVIVSGTRPPNADSFSLLAAPRIGSMRGIVYVPVEKTWSLLPAAYAALGLTINARDTSASAVGDSLQLQGRLGEWSAGEVVDCERPAIPVKNDSARIALFVTTRLEPDSGRTMAFNTVQALTRLPDGSVIACRSRGAIERRLLQEIRLQATRQ